MSTTFRRSGLIVKEDTPISYFPDCMLGMRLGNGAETYFVLSPSFAATALNRSMSKPTTVLPSAARNSLGAYVESVPTVIVPSDEMPAGTIAASAVSFEVVGVAPVFVSAVLESPPQATSTRAARAATAAARAAVPKVLMRALIGSLLSCGMDAGRRAAGPAGTSGVLGFPLPLQHAPSGSLVGHAPGGSLGAVPRRRTGCARIITHG